MGDADIGLRRIPGPARRWLSAGVAALLLVAAWVVAAVTPTEDDAVAPFAVEASIGEPAEGRNIAVTVNAVSAAEALTAGGWWEEGDSVWVVVDLSAEAVTRDQGALLGYAVLRTPDRTFRASERPESLFRTGLHTGIPTRGGLAFELPAAALTGPASLEFALDTETRLDSLVRLQVDLDDLELAAETELPAREWGSP